MVSAKQGEADRANKSASRPSPPRRGGRIAFWFAVVLAFIYIAAQDFAAHTIRKADPELALRIAPSNAAVLVGVLEARLMNGGRGEELRPLAEQAVLREPLNTSAWRALGLVEASNGNVALATKIISFANFLSRRDNSTNIWLIEQYLQQNDIARALEYYDYALRTSLSLREQLTPRLALATAQPEVIEALAATLLRSPGWADDFFAALINYAPDGRNVAELIGRLQAGGYQGSYKLLEGLPKRFVLMGQIEPARRIYSQLSRGKSAALGALAFSVRDPIAPFDWEFASEVGLDAVPLSDGSNMGGILLIRADADRQETAARRLLALPAGEYLLRSPAVKTTGTGSDRLAWTVSCYGGNQALADTRSALTASVPSLQFRVPPTGCAAQWLELSVTTSTDPGAREFEIGSPVLRRIGGE